MFPDTANLSSESRAAIEYMVKGEQLKGRLDGSFDPKAPITREEYAVVGWRLLNWPRLVADELADRTVHIIYMASNGAVGVGTGWFCGPQLIRTGRHVITEAKPTLANALRAVATKVLSVLAWGAGKVMPAGSRAVKALQMNEATMAASVELRCRDFGILLRGKAGWIRSDVNGDEHPYVHWCQPSIDPADLAVIQLPNSLWERYCAARQQQGLGPQPYLTLPDPRRFPIQGEPVAAFGSPLMYEATLTDGRVSNSAVVRTEPDGSTSEWFTATAGINPGNSGGPVISFERELLGMALLKPFYNSAFGHAPADDMGLVMSHRGIRAWDARQQRRSGLVAG